MSFHQTIVVGHLGRDPETRYLPSGDAVANFSVAVTEKWKSKEGDKKESTTWYRINAFGKLAEICGQYLAKGSQVMIVGKMQERAWQDKDGQERKSWELRAETMQILGGRPEHSTSGHETGAERAVRKSGGAPNNRSAQGATPDAFDEDDIPFRQHGAGAAWRVI